MASFDNITNENSSVFEDVDCDPDLEARLYAEIYYSNDTYEQDSTVIPNNPTRDDSLLPVVQTATGAVSNGQLANKDNFAEDCVANRTEPEVGSFADPTTFYPSRSWVRDAAIEDRTSRRENTGRILVKKARLLARKDLWLPRVQPDTETHSGDTPLPCRSTELTDRSSVSNRSIDAANHSPYDRSQRRPNPFIQFHVQTTVVSEFNRASNVLNLSNNKQSKKIGKAERRRANKLKKLESKRKRLRSRDYADSPTDNSKYKVVSKTKKLNMMRRSPEPVNISSDSDDSILEVPVPPKAPPPVVDLHDSDDDDDDGPSSRQSRWKERDEPPVTIEVEAPLPSPVQSLPPGRDEPTVEPGPTTLQTTSAEAAPSIDSQTLEPATPPNSQPQSENDGGKSNKSRSKKCKKRTQDITNENNVDTNVSKNTDASVTAIAEPSPMDSPRTSKDTPRKTKTSQITIPSPNPVETDLILNLTEIQKTVSCLEDIRRMRDTEMLSSRSDDSMTESETNKWTNIADGQSKTLQNDASIDLTDFPNDSEEISMWDALEREEQESRDLHVSSYHEIPSSSGISCLPVETSIPSTSENSFISLINHDQDANTRKRQQDLVPNTFNDFYVPAVPAKRMRPNNKTKTCKKKSDAEYFFQPMSKELKAYYNNPWGGENLDVCDIQSRMPKNPRCWAILNADMQGPASRRRSSCPRCKSDSHYGKRCPEKPKPPCCYMCGTKGHNESRCPHTMCLTCGRKSATYRPTCGHCSKLYCTMCYGAGHSCDECPDLWRRYHSTTTETMPIVPGDASNIMKATQNLSCCNCAKRGHDITTCRQLRWSQHFPTPTRVSSYTDGPMYAVANHYYDPESSNVDDSIHELSRNEDLNTSVASCSSNVDATLHNDSFPVDDIGDDVEDIEIIDEPATASTIASRVIFEAGEFDATITKSWIGKKVRLDTSKEFHLTGLLAGQTKPKFLTNWQKHFDFNVRIIENPNGCVYQTYRYKDPTFGKHLLRVVYQWLSRGDDEKCYLAYDDILPYDDVPRMCVELRKKETTLRSKLDPVKILIKLHGCDRTIATTESHLGSRKSKKNRRRFVAVVKLSESSVSRRCQLITALHKSSKSCSSKEKIRLFFQLSQKIQQRSYVVTPTNYCHLIYLHNELFAFHKTETLAKTLAGAVAAWRETAEKDFTSQYSVEDTNYPSAVFVGMKHCVYRPNAQTIVGNQKMNEQPVVASVSTSGDSVNESLGKLTNGVGSCSFGTVEPTTAMPIVVDEGTSLIRPESTKKTKPRRAQFMFLAGLPNKARKKHERSAVAAMEFANSLNVPKIRKMARDLSLKLSSNTARIRDIQKLNDETVRFRQKLKVSQSKTTTTTTIPPLMPSRGINFNRQSGNGQADNGQPNSSDPAYEKLITTL